MPKDLLHKAKSAPQTHIVEAFEKFVEEASHIPYTDPAPDHETIDAGIENGSIGGACAADNMNRQWPDEQDRKDYPGTAYGVEQDAHLPKLGDNYDVWPGIDAPGTMYHQKDGSEDITGHETPQFGSRGSETLSGDE